MITRVSRYLKHQNPILNNLGSLNYTQLQSCEYHKSLASQLCSNNHAFSGYYNEACTCVHCAGLSHLKPTLYLWPHAHTRSPEQGVFGMLSHQVAYGYSIFGDKGSRPRN